MFKNRPGVAATSMRSNITDISAIKRDHTEMVLQPHDDAPIESMRENFGNMPSFKIPIELAHEGEKNHTYKIDSPKFP